MFILWRAAPAIHTSEELCCVLSITYLCPGRRLLGPPEAASSSAPGRAQRPTGPAWSRGRWLLSAVRDGHLSPPLRLARVSRVLMRMLLFWLVVVQTQEEEAPLCLSAVIRGASGLV